MTIEGSDVLVPPRLPSKPNGQISAVDVDRNASNGVYAKVEYVSIHMVDEWLIHGDDDAKLVEMRDTWVPRGEILTRASQGVS
jgi:hypothetical protein